MMDDTMDSVLLLILCNGQLCCFNLWITFFIIWFYARDEFGPHVYCKDTFPQPPPTHISVLENDC